MRRNAVSENPKNMVVKIMYVIRVCLAYQLFLYIAFSLFYLIFVYVLDRNNERNKNLNQRLSNVKSTIDNKLVKKLKPTTMKLKADLSRAD